MALPVRSFGTRSPTNATVSAIIPAAPRPCRARAAITTGSAGARPLTTEAAQYSASAPRSERRRPSTSPSLPNATTAAVIASRYPMTTHCTAWNGAPNASARAGRATFALLVPSEAASTQSERPMSAGVMPAKIATTTHGGRRTPCTPCVR